MTAVSLTTKLLFAYFELRRWRTNRHIVVFESDDWGSEAFTNDKLAALKRHGIDTKASPWFKDSLESAEDLELLYNVLERHHDSRGRHPVLTANVIVTNPDYDAIRSTGFADYRYRTPDTSLAAKWKEGLKRGVFFPQYHGFAHFNISRWLSDLKAGDEHTTTLFAENICCIPPVSSISRRYSYDGVYVDISTAPSTPISYADQNAMIMEGTDLFERLLGYRSISTIAPSCIWDDTTEKAWINAGIRLIQVAYAQRPGKNLLDKFDIKHRYTGQRSHNNALYTVRNIDFEPFETTFQLKETISEIYNAFARQKPAIINTHRVNFTGAINPYQRDKYIENLNQLLLQVEKEFPDVIYMTSAELGGLIISGRLTDQLAGMGEKVS